jgi:hypothetical protein
MKNYLNTNSILSGSDNNRKKFLLVFLTFLALLGIGGGVLAANITVGTGVVEFGQGTAEAIACDTSITVSPVSTFNGTTFLVSEITLTGVDQRNSSASDSGCGAQNIVVKALNGTTPLASATVSIPTATATSGSFTITPSPSVTANDLTRITLETTN